MVLGGEVNESVLHHRANQRGSWRPLLVVGEKSFGDIEIRIDLLDIKILRGPFGLFEIQSLRRTHRTAVLNDNAVANIFARGDALALRLHIARPRGRVSNGCTDANSE